MKRHFTRVPLKVIFVIVAMFFITLSKLSAQSLIHYGDNIQTSISSSSELDIYEFAGNANDIIRLVVTKTSSFLLPTVEIRHQNGTLVKKLQGTNIRFDTTLSATDNYRIFVSDDNGQETGNYALTLQRLNPPMGAAISYGGNIQSSIEKAAELDAYLFTANANDTVRIVFTKTSSFLFPVVEIFNPEGILVKRLQGTNLVFDTTLSEGGTYTIWATDDNGLETGNYGLRLQRLAPKMGTLVNYGTNVQASIGVPAELDAYLFNGSANDNIRLVATKSSSFLGLSVEIFGPDGSLFKKVQGTNLVIDTVLDKTGVYTIWIMDDNGLETGNYGLTLQRLKPKMGTSIAYGETQQVSIGNVAELDAYLFAGNKSDLVRLIATKTSSFLTLLVEIYDPAGVLVKRLQGTNLAFDTTLSSCGTYTIWVMDDNGLETGNYSLSLNRLAAGPQCASLPVTWISFKGNLQGSDVQLIWSTASEQGSKEFIVEHSSDGANFTAIGTVSAAGTSSDTKYYQYTDRNAVLQNMPQLYYRLKQVDVDGKFTYSSVVNVSIRADATESFMNAFPNPFTKDITLQLTEAATGSNDRIELYSSEGKLICRRSLSALNGTTVLASNLPTLAKGVYMLKVVVNGKTFIRRMLKE